MQGKWWWTQRLRVIRPSSSAGVFESAMNQLVLGIVPDRSGHRRQRGKLSSNKCILLYTMFIDHAVVRVWGPEKVLKFYLSRCWEKGFISCHQHVTISSFERFFFSRWKDSSFPAPGWEDSLFPGAGSRRRRLSSRRRLKPSSFPSAGWELKDQQPWRHTVCLLLSSGRQSRHSLLTAPGWRGARFDSTMTPGYSKFKAQISFSVGRCISAMRWRIIKEQQRCWLLLAFRFRAYTPAL